MTLSTSARRLGGAVALSLTVCLAAACADGGRSGLMAMPSPATDRSPVTLDFTDRPDGPAPTDFGGPASVRISDRTLEKPGFVIRDGRMVFRPRGNGSVAAYFTSGDFGGGTITQAAARFVFLPQGGTPGTFALIVSKTALDLPFGMHLVVTPKEWNVGVWAPAGDASGLTLLQGGTFASPLAQDGRTELAVRVTIDGARAGIELPDGNRVTVCDQRIRDWSGPYATFESLTKAGTDSLVGFTELMARPTGERSTSGDCTT